jgi:hypothetical protein
MSIESRILKCDYPGCEAKVEIHGYGTSWRRDFGWGECLYYGDCCPEHLSLAKADKRLLDRVHDLVASLDVRDRETLVAILKVFGEEPGAGGIRATQGEIRRENSLDEFIPHS